LACKWEPIWVEDVPVQAASKSIRFLQILELTHFVSPNYIVKACWSALFQPHAPIVLVWHGSLSKKPFYETCIEHIERSRNRRRDNILGVDLKYWLWQIWIAEYQTHLCTEMPLELDHPKDSREQHMTPWMLPQGSDDLLLGLDSL
jgi:hypothetical protein